MRNNGEDARKDISPAVYLPGDKWYHKPERIKRPYAPDRYRAADGQAGGERKQI